LDTNKIPGSTFSVDVSVAGVEKLFGYEFRLYYNTTVLTATGIAPYEPFTLIYTRINETGGWVYMSYSMPLGETEGFSTVDPAPIAKIDFTVNTLGESWLEIKNVKLTEPYPKAIPNNVVQGFFANIEVGIHDIAITDITVPSAVQVDEEITVTVAVENEGQFNETFSVSLYYNETFIETKTDIPLSIGASRTLTFIWNTAGVAEGTYTIKAEAGVMPDEFDTGDNFLISGEVTVGEEAALGQNHTLYILVGVVIIVVVVTLVYVLKIRKPKPQEQAKGSII
jgi:hypothetical protein